MVLDICVSDRWQRAYSWPIQSIFTEWPFKWPFIILIMSPTCAAAQEKRCEALMTDAPAVSRRAEFALSFRNLRLQAVQVVNRLASMARGRKDCLSVIFQHLKPVIEIARVVVA